MKKKILILSGGISKERLISLDTGKQVAKELKKNGYKIQISEPDRSLSLNIKKFKPDIIFNALHGQFGEDGYIQSFLEKFKIPYTHSGVLASSIALKNRAEFRDFGTFEKKTIRPRKFINPKTKNVSFLGETHTILFSPSKNLLDDCK